MENQAKAFFDKFKEGIGKTSKLSPDVITGFTGMFKKIMSEGALTVREKELIALGIGVSEKCEPCIRLHVQKCLNAGATKEEILEAASVAVMMGGGPAYTHLPMVVETLEALEA